MFALTYDSSRPTPAPATFGAGILAPARRPMPLHPADGSRLPIGPSAADDAWLALQHAAEAADSWDAWTDEMDSLSVIGAEADASLWPDWTDRIRVETLRELEAEDMLAERRRQVEIDAEYALGRV